MVESDEWMRGTPDQAAALMKPYAGAIEAWEGLSAGSASQFKTAGGIAVAQPSIWLVRHHPSAASRRPVMGITDADEFWR